MGWVDELMIHYLTLSFYAVLEPHRHLFKLRSIKAACISEYVVWLMFVSLWEYYGILVAGAVFNYKYHMPNPTAHVQDIMHCRNIRHWNLIDKYQISLPLVDSNDLMLT